MNLSNKTKMKQTIELADGQSIIVLPGASVEVKGDIRRHELKRLSKFFSGVPEIKEPKKQAKKEPKKTPEKSPDTEQTLEKAGGNK